MQPLSQTPQPGSNDETINKPLQPPPQQLTSNPPLQVSEGTIMQTRPSNPTPQQLPEGTIFQPRAGNGERQPPDKTLFQPRPDTNPGGQQVVDKTIMQQPHAENNQHPGNAPPSIPEKTIFQERPASNQGQQQTPEQTIFQPKKDRATPQKASLNTLQIAGITLAIALTLGTIFYLIFSRISNNNDRRTPTSRVIILKANLSS